MQVFFERLLIARFRLIARAAPGTVLEDLCNRLMIDECYPHRAGVAYEKVLLENADEKTKRRMIEVANRMMPIFVDHALWRPRERAFIGEAMRRRDLENLREDLDQGIKLAKALGLDVSDVELPSFA